MSNVLNKPADFLAKTGIEGLILTGGNDAVPRESGASNYSKERNDTELAALKWAVETGIPAFAVCRGLHMTNLFFGGSVDADIGSLKPAHVAQDHVVEIVETLSGAISQQEIVTNSFHEQGITREGLSGDLLVFATSQDGLIEGVVHRDLPVLAVQWHPERQNSAADLDDVLVSRLFGEGAFWRD